MQMEEQCQCNNKLKTQKKMENKEAYKTHFKNLEEMGKSVGKELGISNWIEISQDKINLFLKLHKTNNGYTLIKKSLISIHLTKPQ